MKTREWSNLILFLIFPKPPFFWAYIKKLAHALFGAWSFLLVHV